MVKSKQKKKSKSPLDLNKVFPNYFHKSIFRAVIILMLLLLIFTYWSNDWNYKFEYAFCPEDSGDGCLLETGKILSSDDNGVIFETVVVASGGYYGSPPNNDAKQFNRRAVFIVLFGFVINHFFYYFKHKKVFPKIDEKELKEWKKKFDGGENERK